MLRVCRRGLVHVVARQTWRGSQNLSNTRTLVSRGQLYTTPSNPRAAQEDDLHEQFRKGYSEEFQEDRDAVSFESIAAELSEAQSLKATNVVRSIADKYLQSPQRDDTLGLHLLKSDAAVKLLTHQQTLNVFHALAAGAGNVEIISTPMLIYVGHICIAKPVAGTSTMEACLAALLVRWSEQDGTGHEHHFSGTWITFSLLRALFKLDTSKGQTYFREMIQSKPWWPPGSTNIVANIDDPATVGSMFMLRCCVSWRWWERAYAIATELVQDFRAGGKGEVANSLHLYLMDLMRSHMKASGPQFQPRLCGALLCSIADNPLFPPPQNAVLQQFYEACTDMEKPRPELASAVYLYLRDKENVDGIGDGAASSKRSMNHGAQSSPKGGRLISLLNHYERTNDHNSAHLLVSDAQKRVEAMPNHILIPYLINLIKLSFSTEARAVYEMCIRSDDPERGAITLLPKVARHLVSLFVSMAEAARRRSISKPKRSRYHLQKAEELMRFAHIVARRFRRSVVPLKKWEHPRLTALAQICFSVGNFIGGFAALKVIQRSEDIVPDAHDFAVLLNLVSSAEPEAGARLLDYMGSRGVQPDSAAFGIVAAQCLKHGNTELAGEVLAKARGHGYRDWDKRLVGAICWHSVTSVNVDTMDRNEIAERLVKVLRQLGGYGKGEAVFRERTFGVKAANLALDIHRPDLALKFWNRCIRYKSIVSEKGEEENLYKDQERLLRTRILRESQRPWKEVAGHLPQEVVDRLQKVPAPQPIKLERKNIDEPPLAP